MEKNSYWQRYWGKRVSRRTLMRGSAVGAAGLAAAAVVGCGDDDEVAPTATPGATTAATATPGATGGAATATPAATAVAGSPTAAPVSFPPPPAYSTISDRQALLKDWYWTELSPHYQDYEEEPTQLGGVFVIPGRGPQFSNHPGEVLLSVFGQWIWGFSHNGLVSTSFSNKGNADLLPFTADFAVSESWETPDPQTFTFKLRSGDQAPRFHARAPANGELMTVDDIKATYEFLATQQFPKLFFETIESITEPSPGIVQIKTKDPAVQMLAGLAYCGYWILHRKHIEEGDEALTTKYIGTGPFQMDEEIPLVSRKMSAVKNWWYGKDKWGNQLPYLDGILHTAFGDREAIKAAYRTGQLDYIRASSDTELEQVSDELNAWPSVIVGNCHSCASFVGLSQDTPLWQNVDARRALSMSINRQSIVDDIYGGAANHKQWIGNAWLGQTWPKPYEEQGEYFKYDPVAAKNLLAQFGVSPETPIEMEFNTEAAEPVAGLGGAQGAATFALELYQADLAAVGINIKFVTHEPRALNPIIYGADGWTGLANASVSGAGLDADVIIQTAVPGAGTNFARTTDEKVREMWMKTREETDPDERTALNNEIEQYVNQDQMHLGVQVPNPFGYSSWRKYNHNLIDPSSFWISGGQRCDSALWWQDSDAPRRSLGEL